MCRPSDSGNECYIERQLSKIRLVPIQLKMNDKSGDLPPLQNSFCQNYVFALVDADSP